jgi:hypothetical protein
VSWWLTPFRSEAEKKLLIVVYKELKIFLSAGCCASVPQPDIFLVGRLKVPIGISYQQILIDLYNEFTG